MGIDHWAIPPAVAVAVFTTVAIVPPAGAPARGLRVEIAGVPSPGRPALVRVAVEDPAGATVWAPRTARLRVTDARGGVRTAVVTGAPGAAFVLARLVPEGAGPYVLDVAAEGHAARMTLASRAALAAVTGTDARAAPEADDGVETVVEGGALVPEVPGTVLVRVRGAARAAVSLVATDAALGLDPPDAQLDACGVAAVGATVRGLDAHVVVRVASSPVPRVARRRLRVAAGGLGVRVGAWPELTVATPSGGAMVYLLSGDARGATGWSVVQLDDPPDANAHAVFRLPDDAQWARVALSPGFARAAGLWVRTPPSMGCLDTPLGERFVRAVAPLPAVPDVAVAYDGAALAQRAREHRRQRARRWALGFAGTALLFLVGLVLTAGLRGDPAALRGVSAPRRQRVALAVGGAGVLLLGGWVLFSAFVLRG